MRKVGSLILEFQLNRIRRGLAGRDDMQARRRLMEASGDVETHWPHLHEILSVPFMVIGAVAYGRYAPLRATKDIDVVVAASDFERAQEDLLKVGFEKVATLILDAAVADGGWSFRSPEGIEVDLFSMSHEWVPDALARAEKQRNSVGLPIVPVEHLMLMKLVRGREQDSADLVQLLKHADEKAIEAARNLIGRYASSDAQDFEAALAIARYEKGEES